MASHLRAMLEDNLKAEELFRQRVLGKTLTATSESTENLPHVKI